MKRIIPLMIAVCVLSGCYCVRQVPYPCQFKHYCQKDYWGDSNFYIFGRKNCVGNTGRWISQNNGRDGFYCTSPKCKTYDRVTCEDTCNNY